ncbi:RDD family protein [Kitasatospora sp. NPDC097643]|uniref:RDD family protein n=1 Tax=Kitasatospora sp. NPDC097643 TaxID=3157230 RepID=UPI0033195B44
MSTQDPSGSQPEGGGKPSFDKPSPPPADGPGGAPGDGPTDRPGAYGGTYGADPHGGPPYDQPPPGYGPTDYGSPGGGPVPGMPPLGSWPRRILARLIDYLLVQAVAVIVVAPFASLSDRSGEAGAFWLACAIYLVYDALMLSHDGQTLGKKAVKVRVAMLVDGNIPSPAAAWTRAAVFILPAVICCAALWWVIDGLFGVFDQPYRQCIHDKSAKTVVVSTA